MPTVAPVSVSGRVTVAAGRGIFKAKVVATNQNGVAQTVRTNIFGYFCFEELTAGETYIFRIVSNGQFFSPQVVTPNENFNGFSFTAQQ